jgi:hypothetical protein
VTHINALALESIASSVIPRSARGARVTKPYLRIGANNRGRVYASVTECVHVFTETAEKTREGDMYIPTHIWDAGSNALTAYDADPSAYLAKLQEIAQGQEEGADEGESAGTQQVELWETEFLDSSSA